MWWYTDKCGDNQSQWRRADYRQVIGITFQTELTILPAVSDPSKVKWTPNAGNSLMLSKGDGWEEGLHWKAKIHGFPQIPVKYTIHRDGLSKSDELHTFWEQVRWNNHCWMAMCIGVREQESTLFQQMWPVHQLRQTRNTNYFSISWEGRRHKLQELVTDRESGHATVHGVPNRRSQVEVTDIYI